MTIFKLTAIYKGTTIIIRNADALKASVRMVKALNAEGWTINDKVCVGVKTTREAA